MSFRIMPLTKPCCDAYSEPDTYVSSNSRDLDTDPTSVVDAIERKLQVMFGEVCVDRLPSSRPVPLWRWYTSLILVDSNIPM